MESVVAATTTTHPEKTLRVQYLSDLHLEFYDHGWDSLQIPVRGDVLVLAGDLGKIWQDLTKQMLKELAGRFPHVVYTTGNHEYYQDEGGAGAKIWTMAAVEDEIAKFCAGYPNMHFLNKSAWTASCGVEFIGCCLWAGIDPMYRKLMQEYMNDYDQIYVTPEKRMTAKDSVGIFESHFKWLSETAEKSKHCVVVTHHMPSFSLDVDPKDGPIKPACCTELDAFIESHKQIAVWICGHSHSPFEKKIGETMCVLNPIGYPHEAEGKDFGKTVDVAIP